jgi:predicted O-methyltransferase YrrM
MKRALLGLVRRPALKRLIERVVVPAGDVMLSPLVLLAALLLKLVRRVGVYRMTVSRAILNKVGVFPIRDHYYEPLFHPRHLKVPLDAERKLPAVDFNEAAQLELLSRFRFADELLRFPEQQSGDGFYYANPNFGPGDAEFLYSAVRHFRPARILEIGSGFSTLVAHAAAAVNGVEDAGYRCDIRCVEPYEMEWLEKLDGVTVLRQTIEEAPDAIVASLAANDILFIDSSHVIRPQGDVVREYLELLPRLAPGVLVHIHDIFSPRDYPRRWVVDEVRLWNEQYLFEAFLSGNRGFQIIGALNYLAHRHPAALAACFPAFRAAPGCEPRSMWLLRTPEALAPGR